jgi:hypothetical protein
MLGFGEILKKFQQLEGMVAYIAINRGSLLAE